MVTTQPRLYPLDLTGTLNSNHIQDEVHTFDTPGSRIFVPNGGCFFSETFIIKDNKGNHLVPIIDYQLLYTHKEATSLSGKNILAVVRILNERIPEVVLDYHVVGGEYSNVRDAIRQELENAGPLEVLVDWNTNVFNKPEVFVPAPHYHSFADLRGLEALFLQLEAIRKAIIAGDTASWETVFAYIHRLIDSNLKDMLLDLLHDHINNPNAHTKSQVGLGNVENYGVATLEDMKNPDSKNPKYVTNTNLVTNLEALGYFREKFKVEIFREGDEVVFVFRSNDLFSDRPIDLTITETDASDTDIANRRPDNPNWGGVDTVTPKPVVIQTPPSVLSTSPAPTPPKPTTTDTGTGARRPIQNAYWTLRDRDNKPVWDGGLTNQLVYELTIPTGSNVVSNGEATVRYELLNNARGVIKRSISQRVAFANNILSFDARVAEADLIHSPNYIRWYVEGIGITTNMEEWLYKLPVMPKPTTVTTTPTYAVSPGYVAAAEEERRRNEAYNKARTYNSNLDKNYWVVNFWNKGILYTGQDLISKPATNAPTTSASNIATGGFASTWTGGSTGSTSSATVSLSSLFGK